MGIQKYYAVQTKGADQYKDFIIKRISDGMTQTDTAKRVKDLGVSCGLGNIRLYVFSVAKQYQLEVTKYVSSNGGYAASEKVRAEYITQRNLLISMDEWRTNQGRHG